MLRMGRDKARLAILESETDHECKDEYIHHLSLLLEPHLGLLPITVAKEIHNLPEEIGVNVTPTDC